jgi:hypothetical protein
MNLADDHPVVASGIVSKVVDAESLVKIRQSHLEVVVIVQIEEGYLMPTD